MHSSGEDWDKAWSTYVKKWKNPCQERGTPDQNCYLSSKRVKAMNDDKFNIEYHSWSDIHVSACHYDEMLIREYGEIHYLVHETSFDFGHTDYPFVELEYEGIGFFHEGFLLPRYPVESVRYNGVVCKILASSIETDSFDVVYFMGDTEDLEGAKTLWRLRGLPSSHVIFHHRPFQSDLMRPGAFRHEIAFPDEVFPSLWKDLVYK